MMRWSISMPNVAMATDCTSRAICLGLFSAPARMCSSVGRPMSSATMRAAFTAGSRQSSFSMASSSVSSTEEDSTHGVNGGAHGLVQRSATPHARSSVLRAHEMSTKCQWSFHSPSVLVANEADDLFPLKGDRGHNYQLPWGVLGGTWDEPGVVGWSCGRDV